MVAMAADHGNGQIGGGYSDAKSDANKSRSLDRLSSDGARLTIVSPFYCEEMGVVPFFDRLIPVLETMPVVWDVIAVDDGSHDATFERLRAVSKSDRRVKAIRLARNFGKEIALCAGLDHAGGDAVVIIDGDLEEPPEIIPRLFAEWRKGHLLVFAERSNRKHDHWMRRFGSWGFYSLFNRISGLTLNSGGDFHILDREIVLMLREMREHNRFTKGLFTWAGYQRTTITYERRQRVQGRSRFNYWRLWNLALNFITAFSSLPIRIWSYIGIFISGFAFFYSVFLLIWYLAGYRTVEGYTSTILSILFLGGIQLISLGFIGEYIARVFDEVRNRPLYVVKETLGIENRGQPFKT
jgi:glycosyltransferase involved in cell wall biosynthesis